MTSTGTRRNSAGWLLLGLAAASLAVLPLLPPIAQDQAYHRFADERAWLGIPNFGNVVSNLPFVAVGAAGLWRRRGDAATLVLFLGILLTGLGSAYYHWDPNDAMLFWDRLPMTLAFAAILAIGIGERASPRLGAALLWPFLGIGLFSLLLWRWTGDLRLYFWMQFFPGLALLALFLLYPARYTGAGYWIVAALFYALAKLFEFADHAVFSLGQIVSGHTLKHLAAAAACCMILRHCQTRRPVGRRIG
jgi:hypothetical protein